MRNVILIFFLFFFLHSIGKTTSSTSSGSWDVVGNWNNGLPSLNSDDIIISTGDSIKNTSTSITIGTNATLTIRSGAKLVVNNITFNNGSVIIVESGGVLIVLGNLTNKNNSNDISIEGSLIVSGDLSNGNNSVIFGNGEITSSTYSGSCCIMGYNPVDLPNNSTISDSIVLPIELIYFNVKHNNNKVYIDWSTLTESNNDYFTIQKSIDMIEWITSTKIKGAGNSNKTIEYQYIDVYLENYIYYRLVQVDYDGNFTIFHPSIMVLNENKNENMDFIIYPNPNNDNVFYVKSLSIQSNIFMLKVYDSLYKLVLEKDLYFKKHIETIEFDKNTQGIYFIYIYNYKQEYFSTKLIKTN